ncbi:MAG: Na+/H+ antiporter NhaA [Bacteroidaceae bacterium]
MTNFRKNSREDNYFFLRFFRAKINSGALLIIVACLAIFVANSPWADFYNSLWNHPVLLQVGSFNLFSHDGHPMTVMSFINDALMAVFFFSIGLEIKREVLVGQLSSFRRAMLPVCAAFGGMIFPVLIYHLIAPTGVESSGLAIPMATDIAFSLGVLSMFGNRVPLSLKIFLTAFAVVDDIGGILVIALFYSNGIETMYLIGAGILLLILFIGNRRRVMTSSFYLLLGIGVWYMTLQSGIHSTIAGVLVAFMVPAIPQINVSKYINRISEGVKDFPTNGKKSSIILNSHELIALHLIESASKHVVSPLQRLEDSMHGLINFLVMPLFAFANAGVSLASGTQLVGIVSIGVTSGLVLGKFVGILLFTWLAIKIRLVRLPDNMNWPMVAGVALLGGIGFTVSLFISNLSFADTAPALLNQAKMGVFSGTIIAGTLGVLVLSFVLPKRQSKKEI